MNGFFAALTFLTIIPVPKHLSESSKFEGCEKFFPLIGIIIGVIASFFCYFVGMIFPPMVTAAISVVILLKITGGLHMDGLSDTLDGLCSYSNKEKTLAIMKDSCIGSMGSLIQICVIILKVSALYELGKVGFLAIFIAPIVGRTSILLISYLFKPARTDGLGYTVNNSVSKSALAFGLVLSFSSGLYFFGRIGGLAVLLALASTLVLGKISKMKIGGYTGDILGAGCELSEMYVLLVLSASVM